MPPSPDGSFSWNKMSTQLSVEIYETSASGKTLARVSEFSKGENPDQISIFPEQVFQTITGFGGSFTQASAYLMNRLGEKNRERILEAYFGESGARYSLTRTHINSCDFSLGHYSYAQVAGDSELKHFSIEEDMDDLIPMIKAAMEKSAEGFKLIASPWTAPPWMKDNQDWCGGKLLKQYYGTWALYFSRYLKSYKKEGIDIWGITVENEPLGNNHNWESMHFTPEEMTGFVRDHLGPKLKAEGHNVKILGYDQNRGKELEEWVKIMYQDEASSQYFDGTAVHWYASTYDWFPDSLQFAHAAAPDKHLIQTEACVDAETPRWKDDLWYWSKEATDWGWNWAPEEEKYLHPKYTPVFRYARDIIGCLNNWVDGWIDWNMILDRQGGPNWAKNWCVAPIIVDPDQDEVYFTPIYYTLSHFSRFIRPGAKRIGWTKSDENILLTAVRNPDNSIAVVIFNQVSDSKHFTLEIQGKTKNICISGEAIQTIVIPEP